MAKATHLGPTEFQWSWYMNTTLAKLKREVNKLFGRTHGRQMQATYMESFYRYLLVLLPDYPVPAHDAEKLIEVQTLLKEVADTLGSEHFKMASAQIWPYLVQLSEGNYERGNGWPTNDKECRALAAAARTLRDYLSEGEDEFDVNMPFLLGPRNIQSTVRATL